MRDHLLPALSVDYTDGPASTIIEIALQHLQLDDQVGLDVMVQESILCPSRMLCPDFDLSLSCSCRYVYVDHNRVTDFPF